MVKCDIKDVTWTFDVLDHVDFVRKYGKDEHASTNVMGKWVVFDRKYLSKGLIAHELLHVYVFSCCVFSATTIQSNDMEEICAEIMEYHLDAMVKHRNNLWKELK